MNQRQPRRLTREYARGLVAAVAIFTIAMLVFTWGITAFLLERDPITTTISKMTAPAIVLLCLALLIFVLWRDLISMVKGHPPTYYLLVVVPAGVYLLWSLLTTALNLSISEAWLSPFALGLAACWAIALLLFWWILLRRLYSDKGRPQWPWEKKDLDEGPDWFKDGQP